MPAIDPTTLGEATERAMQRLEMRIMRDIVRRIRDAEFSTASADWQISRLQQLGHAEEQVKEWVQDALGASDEEIEEIFSDEVYRSYVGNEPAYRHTGKQQTPYSENYPLQQTVRAMHEQTSGTLKNITRSMGFVEVLPGTRRTRAVALTDFYRQTLDDAIYDIQSGAFDYTSVLKRTVSTMTRSGIRQIDYASGSASRIDVAARRAVMTGFRQVQGKISEQTAAELGTDTFEVSYHGGARPSHAEWQGGVYTKQELADICGLGDVTGLCGANCYHTYWPFIPGVDKPVYSADELERMRAQDQQTRTYQGREYTPYEATQAQRDLERRMRKDEEDLYLLREGGADEETLALKEAHLNGLRQTYSSFSDRMELPKHWERARAMDPDDAAMIQARSIAFEGIPRSWKKVAAEEVTIKAINPQYGSRTRGYDDNCFNCVPAYEMRKRGYKVVARPSTRNHHLRYYPEDAWIEPDVIETGGTGYEDILSGFSLYPVGARAEVSVIWEGSDTGHVFVAEKREKGIAFLDVQSGKEYNKSIFEKVQKGKTRFWRIDILEPSDRGITACETG